MFKKVRQIMELLLRGEVKRGEGRGEERSPGGTQFSFW